MVYCDVHTSRHPLHLHVAVVDHSGVVVSARDYLRFVRWIVTLCRWLALQVLCFKVVK
jgi:hypothetical protein